MFGVYKTHFFEVFFIASLNSVWHTVIYMSLSERISYVYGPVYSWRSGNSLGIDPIGAISTCSFNCSYCQLGQIQNISTERKIYVKTEDIIADLDRVYNGMDAESSIVDFSNLDVITFAGSGEPSLALNLGEIITEIKKWLSEKSLKAIPVSILTNATLLKDPQVRTDLKMADLISLKLDAVDELSLKSINQADKSISLKDILEGIKLLKSEIQSHPILQLQIMFMPKFAENKEYLKQLAEIISDLGIYKIQINTPTRAKPKSGKEYWIETRGNHYREERTEKEYIELPVISEEQAFFIEDFLSSLIGETEKGKNPLSPQKQLTEIEIKNVYRR